MKKRQQTPEEYLSTNMEPPSARVRWTITEIAKGTQAAEPAIIIHADFALPWYAEFLYRLCLDDEDPLPVWFQTHRNGWDLMPILYGELEPPAVISYSVRSVPDWVNAGLLRERIRQANTLWRLGHPLLLWAQDPESLTNRGALIVDHKGTYGELDRRVTRQLMLDLHQIGIDYEMLEVWQD